MIREAYAPKKLLVFEDKDAFLKNEDPKRVRQNVIKNGEIRFGSKIELDRGDLIIITIMFDTQILISVSNYKGFGKFEEKFLKIAKIKDNQLLEGLDNQELRIIETNIAALKATA